jgi:hypothetical protein
MEVFGNILLAGVPAGIVLYGSYLLVKTFVEKEQMAALGKLQIKTTEIALPMRFHAYERMVLYLERITPNNLISRLNNGEMNIGQMHFALVHTIREEFNHNLTQQLYISDEVWQAIVGAREEMIAMLNQVADGMDQEGPGIDLARAVFQHVLNTGNDYTSVALYLLKNEARGLMPLA